VETSSLISGVERRAGTAAPECGWPRRPSAA
jgi:hypothetical protein